MHCSLLYEVLNDPSFNVLSGLTVSQWRESRKIILNMILGTDMVHHFEQIKNAQVTLPLPPLRQQLMFFVLCALFSCF